MNQTDLTDFLDWITHDGSVYHYSHLNGDSELRFYRNASELVTVETMTKWANNWYLTVGRTPAGSEIEDLVGAAFNRIATDGRYPRN